MGEREREREREMRQKARPPALGGGTEKPVPRFELYGTKTIKLLFEGLPPHINNMRS